MSRSNHISNAFSYFENPSQVKVLEIGFGNGRDAEEILKYTKHYTGIDYSAGMVDLAKTKLPYADLRLCKIEDFESEEKYDIILAFASLVHLNKDEMEKVLKKIKDLMNPDGIFFLSLKYSQGYGEYVDDKNLHGKRFFGTYDCDTINSMIPGMEVLEEILEERKGGSQWLDMVFKKPRL